MPTCSECKFFDDGLCRRYPPRVFLAPPEDGSVFQSRWPEVFPADYCGEFVAATPGA